MTRRRLLPPSIVIARYQAGELSGQIAAAYHATPEAVRALLRRHQVSLRGRGGPNNPNGGRDRTIPCPWPPGTLRQHLLTATPAQLAAGQHISIPIIHRWARTAGLNLRELARLRATARKRELR